MTDLGSYLSSQDFIYFMQQRGVWLILTTIAISFVALLLEIRLPLRYYWGLPGHILRSLLAGLHIVKPHPVWGICYVQSTKQGMPLVACDLLDAQTHKLIKRTYSNHRGQYGFSLQPGKYLIQAVKTRYRLPSMLDPENVEVYEVDESFLASVVVINTEVVPVVDLPLVPIKEAADLKSGDQVVHYGRMMLFQLANAFLILDVVLALAGWSATRELFYAIMIVVCLALLFVKLYLLELIRIVTVRNHA